MFFNCILMNSRVPDFFKSWDALKFPKHSAQILRSPETTSLNILWNIFRKLSPANQLSDAVRIATVYNSVFITRSGDFDKLKSISRSCNARIRFVNFQRKTPGRISWTGANIVQFSVTVIWDDNGFVVVANFKCIIFEFKQKPKIIMQILIQLITFFQP